MAGGKIVVARSAKQCIVPEFAVEAIVAVAAVETIVAAAGVQTVIPRAAEDHGVASEIGGQLHVIVSVTGVHVNSLVGL